MASNVRFYRLNSLPTFVQNTHQGLFVYLNNNILDGQNNVITPKGLWFGGSTSWELLTNVQGITLQDVMNWMDGQNNDYPFNGEADIFGETSLQSPSVGTEYTIYDVLLDSTGIHASSDSSDAHTFTVGDGALKITGKAEAVDNTDPQNPVFTNVDAFDVHSANDTVDNTLTFDESMFVTKGSTGAPYAATIGVRVKTPVSPTNPIITLEDIVGLNGAMHLIGTLDHKNDLSVGAEHIWPDQYNDQNQPISHWTTGTPASGQEQIKAGDAFIVTTAHSGPETPDAVWYEVGDMVVYYNDANNNLTYKVVNTNITDGVLAGQHAHNTEDLVDGKLVIAVAPQTGDHGIKTIDLDYTDLIVGIDTTQEIVNENAANAEHHEGQIHGATYTATTTIDRVDDGSDSNISTDIHSFTLHSNNNSLTIQEHNAPDGNQQFDFDLVWLTEMDGFNG